MIVQSKFMRDGLSITKIAAEAAKDSAEIARDALVKIQRPFVSLRTYNYQWHGDLNRPGKFFYSFDPILENSGVMPTEGMDLVDACVLVDAPLPDGFGFPYQHPRGATLIGPKVTISAQRIFLIDELLLAVQRGEKFFYIYGEARYRDAFNATPLHITQFCPQITGVFGDPLNPIDPNNPNGCSVRITFNIYREHNSAN